MTEPSKVEHDGIYKLPYLSNIYFLVFIDSILNLRIHTSRIGFSLYFNAQKNNIEKEITAQELKELISYRTHRTTQYAFYKGNTPLPM